ncbi:MAG: hypothetical protein N2442_14145 [Spirochaetes bacterium]|nr:hypothetical protein [Spirochaetota bacterium]
MDLNRVVDVEGKVPIRRAIVSVSHKTGLKEFILSLVSTCPEIVMYSTGGTYTAMESYLGAGQALKHLRRITEYTGQPEMQGGLVKTLDYRIYLGLLSETYNESHRTDLRRMQVDPFDLVVVNLYPFQEAVTRTGATVEEGRTHIDIGGPTLLRAGAKNFLRVATLCDPADYPEFLQVLRTHGGATTLAERFRWAKKVFRLTASYDAAISSFFDTIDEASLEAVYTIH